MMCMVVHDAWQCMVVCGVVWCVVCGVWCGGAHPSLASVVQAVTKAEEKVEAEKKTKEEAEAEVSSECRLLVHRGHTTMAKPPWLYHRGYTTVAIPPWL